MLVLFDIDGTLLRSKRAGLRAMATAIHNIHGVTVDFDKIQTAGSLDPLIWKDILDQHDIEPNDTHHNSFRTLYTKELSRLIETEQPVEPLPGVHEAVHFVRDHTDAVCALLTGNYQETGWLKVEAAGFSPSDFEFGTWGTEAPERRGLPIIALQRNHSLRNNNLHPSKALVVGDTPADIDCARANGCRSLAVATGKFDVPTLESHGADVVMEDLGDSTRFQQHVDELIG